MNKIARKKITKTCNNCLKGSRISINGDILCNIRGIVSPDFSCKKHRFTHPPELHTKPLKCMDCEYFKPSEADPDNQLGVCRLFSEREFNGSHKKACSKIIRSVS